MDIRPISRSKFKSNAEGMKEGYLKWFLVGELTCKQGINIKTGCQDGDHLYTYSKEGICKWHLEDAK